MKNIVIILFLLAVVKIGNAQCTNPTYTANNGTFNDGSGAGNYTNNLNCEYLISVDPLNRIRISFSDFDVERADEEYTRFNFQNGIDEDWVYDYVLVYDGNSRTGTPLGFFENGYNQPGNTTIESSGNELLIVFVTDPTIERAGWTIEYESIYPKCTNPVFTAESGTFDDGSGAGDHENDLDCEYLISVDPSKRVRISFSEFDVEAADQEYTRFNFQNGIDEDLYDYVLAYDGNSRTGIPIGFFENGFNQPGSTILESSGNEMLIVFITDGTVVHNGWTINYSTFLNTKLTFTYDACGNRTARTFVLNTVQNKAAQQAKGNEQSKSYTDKVGKLKLDIYPNPTKGEVNVLIENYKEEEEVTIYIYNLSGELVQQLHQASEFNTLDLSNEASGIYLMKVRAGEQSVLWKIVKE